MLNPFTGVKRIITWFSRDISSRSRAIIISSLFIFSLAMIFGLLVGTYSSVFVASPIVLLWGGNKPLRKK